MQESELTASGAARSSACLPPENLGNLGKIVRILAGRLHARLPYDCGIEVADLIQAGNLGLLQATRSFESERGAPLAGYAKFRIRGEMLEVVRRSAESARMVGDDVEALDGAGKSGVRCTTHASDNSPQSSLLRRQRAQIVGEAVKRLPARYRTVVRLRYSGEMTLRQIGAALDVNESRASQIHRSALNLLKRALRNRGVRDLSHL